MSINGHILLNYGANPSQAQHRAYIVYIPAFVSENMTQLQNKRIYPTEVFGILVTRVTEAHMPHTKTIHNLILSLHRLSNPITLGYTVILL